MANASKEDLKSKVYIAIRTQNIQQVERIINQDPNLLNQEPITPLYIAAFFGCIEICKFLIEKGADINKGILFLEEETPLGGAALCGHIEICRLLIEKGADVNKGDEPPIYLASLKGHTEICKLLISKGANVDHIQNVKNYSSL
eukprot:TRINITY_DN1775_c2_g1_i2.p1 TRINITY_DN1775_c2_g1~~TRINITY_DN1775_c2_g1_i2.p1  ORF type:complete len:144 (+),score=45.43 TRINITY_DN1775_c2_g1_i2:105-536(+)